GEHFDHWVKFFEARGIDAVAPTLRGRDSDDPLDAGTRFADYFNDALTAVKEMGRRPVVIGHSLGGLIALKLAEAGACRAAVLIASAPAGALTAQPRSLPSLLPMFPRILSGQLLQPPVRALERIVLNAMPADERAKLIPSFVTESGVVYREMVLGLIRIDSSKVHCPILCIGGSDDRIVSKRLVRGTARQFGAQLREYPGHAHWLIAEPGWERIASDVAAWLSDRELIPKTA